MILACAARVRSAEQIRRLAGRKLDWEAVIEQAGRQRLTPVVFAALEESAAEGIPGAVRERLRISSTQHAIHNLKVYAALAEVLAAFSAGGIPVVGLKGIALAKTVYSNLALRPVGDIDLLVRPSDLEAAHDLLLRLDYVPDESVHPQEWYRTTHHHLAPCDGPGGAARIELHHHIHPAPWMALIPIGELWQRARPVAAGGAGFSVFAPEDLILHTCLHLSQGRCFLTGLLDLRDVAEVIAVHGRELDWDLLADRARAYRTAECLYYALWAAEKMLGAEVPAAALRSLAADRRRGVLDDLGLKRLIGHALLRGPESRLPVWVMEDVCGTLLSPTEPNPAGMFFKAAGRRLVQAVMQAAARQPQPATA